MNKENNHKFKKGDIVWMTRKKGDLDNDYFYVPVRGKITKIQKNNNMWSTLDKTVYIKLDGSSKSTVLSHDLKNVFLRVDEFINNDGEYLNLNHINSDKTVQWTGNMSDEYIYPDLKTVKKCIQYYYDKKIRQCEARIQEQNNQIRPLYQHIQYIDLLVDTDEKV